MLKKLLIIAALLPLVSTAQTVSDFEGLIPAAQQDTFYVNYSTPRTDVGFNSGLAHFPHFTDTSTFQGFTSSYWEHGFAYSNKRDTSNGTYTNQYSAKPGKGYNNSATYAIAYGDLNTIKLTGAAIGKSVIGFYVTNTTYTYNSIKNGDGFARKFGDTTGTHAGLPTQGSYPDYFKMTIRGYSGGLLKSDSVDFYLADYTFSNNANDYIIKDWQYVNLLPLGHVDSIQIKLFTTVNNAFGPATPFYFALDNFTTDESGLGITTPAVPAAKVFPNPAQNELHVMLESDDVERISVYDGSGREVRQLSPAGRSISISLEGLSAGTYFLNIRNKSGLSGSQRFIKN